MVKEKRTYPNGWGLSIIQGKAEGGLRTYSNSKDNTYEVAIIGRDGEINYDFFEDVLPYQTLEDIVDLETFVKSLT